METYVELVDWNKFKYDIKADETDDNDGCIYGLFHTDKESGDTYEVEWFKTEEERDQTIKELNAIILNN